MSTPEHLEGKTVGQLRELARRDANAALDVHWPDRSIPIDPVDIARKLGASVFTAELGDDVYGMIKGDPAGANIYVDRDSARSRQRFTIAHELGHLVSHQGELTSGDVAFVDARSDAGTGTTSEVYANEFAASCSCHELRLKRPSHRG